MSHLTPAPEERLYERVTAIAGSPAPASEPGLPPFPPSLGWSHYLALLRVSNDQARSFYEIEAAREGWSVRELERQIAALLFERLTQSCTPSKCSPSPSEVSRSLPPPM